MLRCTGDTEAGAAAGEAAGSTKQDEAATPAEAALVSRLVAAIGGAFFDNGDIRGVKPVGEEFIEEIPVEQAVHQWVCGIDPALISL